MDFEAALSSIPETEEAFNNYDWVRPVTSYLQLVDNISTNNFYVGGTSISDAIEKLKNIDEALNQTQIFYQTDDSGKRNLLVSIVQRLDEFMQKKMFIDSRTLGIDIGRYNDNLERARTRYYRKFLRQQCDEYNHRSNRRVMAIDYYFEGTHPDYFDAGEYYDEFWKETDTGFQQLRSRTRYPVTTEYYKIYDEIHYNALLPIDTFFDMKNDEMVKALQKRGYKTETFERPSDTYYN